MSGLGRILRAIADASPLRPSPARELAEALRNKVVSASRAPALYGEGRTPDTMDGRFEAATLHACLALIRLQREPEARQTAQLFTDSLFRWLDSGLHEAGIGYQKVPKEIRAFAARFYGRLEAYDAALKTEGEAALAEALARNIVRAGPEDWPFARTLAAHVRRTAEIQARADWRALADAAQWPLLV